MQSIDFIDSGPEGEIFPKPCQAPRPPALRSSPRRIPDPFSADLRRMERKYAELWRQSPTTLPELGPAYDCRQQRQHERKTDRQIERLEKLLRSPPTLSRRRSQWRRRVQKQVEILAIEGLAMDRRQSPLVMNDEFFDVTMAFARRARRLDPKLELQDLTQAWRNLWVMNLCQMLLGRSVTLTPSIFAYSMLYPYTDNPLDDEKSSLDTKKSVGARLASRLQGRVVEPRDAHERIVFGLVAEIEKEHSRARHPAVYESLLAIHRGQMASLAQHGGERLGPADLLALSVAKGGASVLADGYLVHPRLTHEQADFFFGYGVLLQLCDDLQDAHDDLRKGQITLFSRQISARGSTSQRKSHAGVMDPLVCRLCHFSAAVLEGCRAFDRCREEPLRELIYDNCRRLIVHAVGDQPQHFSPGFLEFANRHSPLSFAYAQTRKQALLPKWQRLLERSWRHQEDERPGTIFSGSGALDVDHWPSSRTS